MRLLFIFNLVAIVIIAGALGKLYEGTPLPAGWRWPPVAEVPQNTLAAPVEQQHAAGDADDISFPLTNPRRTPSTLAETEAPATETPQTPQSRPVLNVLTEGAYPPFNFREGSKLSGFDVEITEAICARLERECHIAARRWDDLLPLLKKGEADAIVASMLIPSPARDSVSDPDIAFSERYYATPAHFAARRDTSLSGVGSLSGKRIAVQAGSVHKAYLQKRFPDAVLVETPGVKSAEAALAKGEADLVFADRNALLLWMKAEGKSCCRLIGADYSDAHYFGLGAGIVSRASDTQLRSDINKALADVMSDGLYAQISNRYFGQSIR